MNISRFEKSKSFESYCKQISKYPLLTPEREKIISKMIHNSKKKKVVEKYTEELILCNLKLVVSCAIKIYYKHLSFKKDNWISLMDLIEEGNLILINNVDKFDASLGKFSTYMGLILMRKLEHIALCNNNFIYIPEKHYFLIKDMRTIREKFGKNLTESFILEKTGMSKELYKHLLDSENSIVSHYENFFNQNENNDDISFLDLHVSDEKQTLDIIDNKQLQEYVYSLIRKLPKRHQEILIRNFFDNSPHATILQSKRMKITRQRVNMLLLEALRKLRKSIEIDVKYGRITMDSLRKNRY